MDEDLQQAKRPVTALAGTYGHPLHPILVTVPIGAWVSSFVFDLASWGTDIPRVLATGSLWLIAIGVIGALAAAMVGFLDFAAIPPRTRAFRLGSLHMVLNLAVTAAYGTGFVLRSGETAGPVPAALIALSAVSLAALGVSGVLGGKLAFRYGVRVADEATQAEGYRIRNSRTHTPSGGN